jgi:hypothetical protein
VAKSRLLALWLLVALVAAQCRIAGPLAGPDSSVIAQLPNDAQRFGTVVVATPQESEGAIASEDAVGAAAKDGYSWPSPRTYLVVVTSKTVDATNPYSLDGALAWLIYWDDVKVAMPAPTSTELFFTKVLVLVDARTGVVIRDAYIEY